jgi:hypothetical protein
VVEENDRCPRLLGSELEKREREEKYEEFINVYGRENERDDDLIQSLNLLKNNTMPPLVVKQCLDFPEPIYIQTIHSQYNKCNSKTTSRSTIIPILIPTMQQTTLPNLQ